MGYCSPAFRIGEIEAVSLWDGPLPTTLDKIPDPLHRAEAERLVAAGPEDALTMNVYSFLLRIGGLNILVDTGAGRLSKPTLGQLPRALFEAGVDPNSIDVVFITHIAGDHFGGLATPAGGAAFPKAKIVIHEEEARFWLDRNVSTAPERLRSRMQTAREYFSLYGDRVERVIDGQETYGVSARFTPGHTPGHTSWLVRSQNRSLLAWGDLVHIAYIHLPAPHIAMEYDMDPEMALNSRLAVLEWVAREKIIVAGTHLPTPGIGTVVRELKGYRFEGADA